MLNRKLHSKKGFTLMEMLIVVAIIVILVAIAIPTFSGALERARVSADEANVRAWYAEIVAANLLDETAVPTDFAAYDGPALQAGAGAIAANVLTYTPNNADYDPISWDLPAA